MAFDPSDPFPKRYAKALSHMNHASRTQRLGMILGSGVSDNLGIPKWKDLIERIEKKLGYESGNSPESYRAEQLYRIVFDRDVAAIKSCDALIIHLDGRTVDEGAAFELGLAHALGKPCVGYRTDVRVLLPWGINPMIAAPLSDVFGTIEELEHWAKMLSTADIPLRPRLVAG